MSSRSLKYNAVTSNNIRNFTPAFTAIHKANILVILHLLASNAFDRSKECLFWRYFRSTT